MGDCFKKGPSVQFATELHPIFENHGPRGNNVSLALLGVVSSVCTCQTVGMVQY